ncbi:MAG: acetyl esterase/lipase [Cyclobacteriaceae bacterium]|jgi:acetyl esterase/lipase
MIKLILLLSTVFLSHMLYAQDHNITLWGDKVPNAKKSNTEEMLELSDTRRISKVVNPTIEVYLPSKSNSIKKAILICPGGGYGILAYDKEGTDIAKWLNGHGIAGIVLKYRLPEDESNIVPHESPLMDAKRGMEIIRENASSWGIAADQIGIMGFSAGGHLASTLGTHFEEKNRPDFMILIYPVVTMKDDYTHKGSRNNLLGQQPSDDLVELYSNELQVKSSTPATFIVHSEDDKAVPVDNSLQFYKALRDSNVPAEMHIFPFGGHGYSLAIGKGRHSTWPNLMIDWIGEL